MKISCTQENLNQGLFVVSHVASKNTSLPILNNILIKADKGDIKLLATNLEIGISCSVRGKIEEPGEFTVQSRLLADYVNLLPKDQVDLESPKDESTNQILKVKSKKSSTKINGQNAADFPLIPQVDKDNLYVIKASDLKQAISQVIFSVSTSETRPEINGVFFSFNKGKVVMAATDSYRLAEKEVQLDKRSSGGENNVIIPTRTLQELQRILGSFKDPAAISDMEDIDIYLSNNQILFSFGGIELTSRLIEGKYPDYRQIIPQNSSTKISLNTQDLVSAVKKASLFARSGIYDISIDFSVKDKKIVVSSVNNQLGENTSEIESDISGEDNNIVVNFRYLLDGLQNINNDQISLEVIDSSSPCTIKPVKDSGYLYIVMPIKQ